MLGSHTVSTLRALAATAFACVAGAAAGQAPELPIESIDVYGSGALDSAAIRAEFAADIELYVAGARVPMWSVCSRCSAARSTIPTRACATTRCA
jgi:hypothetical protein